MSDTVTLPRELVDADYCTWERDPTGDVYGCVQRQQWGLTADEVQAEYGLAPGEALAGQVVPA